MNRPTHIEDYLTSLHNGQWFAWSDADNKVYANLIILDDTKDKPSESDCTTGLATLQSDYDNNAYQRDRVYPSIGDQLDMQYKDLLNGTTTWKDAVAKVKSDNPKD